MSFSIPMGDCFTGDFGFLTFAADKDSNPEAQESFFRNIVFRESARGSITSEPSSLNKVVMDPNTTHRHTTMKSLTNNQIGEITVHSPTDRTVKRIPTTDSTIHRIDASDLPQSLYFVRFSLNGIIQTKKLIVKHK